MDDNSIKILHNSLYELKSLKQELSDLVSKNKNLESNLALTKVRLRISKKNSPK
jgi:hypothetical protein